MSNNPKIFNLSDITKSKENAEATKRKYGIAKEHCENEIEELTGYMEKFCQAISKKFAITNVFNLSSVIMECYSTLVQNGIIPFIENSSAMKNALGEAEYNRTRKEIYESLVANLTERGIIENEDN